MLKKVLIGAAAAFMFCVFHPANAVDAEASDSVKVDSSCNVTLISDHAASEEITTLQLSLNVETDTNADVSFEFDEENNVKISEYRYNKDSNLLNIYVSDSHPLFDGKDELNIGTVSAKDKNGKNVGVKVNAIKSTMNYVYNNKLETINLNVDLVSSQIKGDMNRNESIDFLDLVQLSKLLLHPDDVTPEQLAIADLNDNGEVDFLDLVLLSKKLIKNK